MDAGGHLGDRWCLPGEKWLGFELRRDHYKDTAPDLAGGPTGATPQACGSE